MGTREKKILAAGILAVAATAAACLGTVAFVSAKADSRMVREEEGEPESRENSFYGLETTAYTPPATTAAPETALETAPETAPLESVSYVPLEEGNALPEEEAAAYLAELVVDQNPAIYTYEDMEHDMKLWEKVFPQLIHIISIGKTFDGREIYDMVIGDSNSANHIMINGAIHAREYMTAQLVMKQAAEFIKHPEENQKYLENTAIHVIPMINPDGVTISQFGPDKLNNQETKDLVQVIGQLDGAKDMESYYRRWKSNAQGIDVNRNFDALWEEYQGPDHPSADHYKGEAVGCVPESAALIQLTNQYHFVRTVSYHTQGGVIYWYFGQDGELKEQTEAFAKAVSASTGYPMDANYEKLDPAGYKDWCISKLGIPSLTIEVGRETSPVDPAQFAEVWNQNKDVWSVILDY